MSSLLKSPLVAGGRTIGPDTSYRLIAGVDPDGEPVLLSLDATGAQSATTAVKQLSGVPSSFAVQTADQTVFTLAAGEIGFIQNLDDAALAVKKGASASTSSFSFILAAGSAADAGNGGSVLIDDWIGAVSVAAMSGAARYVAWKTA